jgi:hypothetical protein
MIDRYEIFSYGVEARVRALGASENVNGSFSISQQANLSRSPYNYEYKHPGHGKQFRSYIQKQRYYWQKVLSSFGL